MASTVKFYLNPFYLTDNYCPEAIQLADGFKAMGWNVLGNINYWVRSDGFLISEDNLNTPVDLVIMDHRFVHHTKSWVIQGHVQTEKEAEAPRVLLERQCGQEQFPQWNRDGWLGFFDLILATDRTAHHPSHQKIAPWQIGVIQEVIDSIDESKGAPTSDSVLCNFRVGHDVRGRLTRDIEAGLARFQRLSFLQAFDALEDESSAEEKSLNTATGGRFNPSYLSRIGKHLGVLAYGGYLVVKPFEYTSMDAEGKLRLPWTTRLERKVRRTLQSSRPEGSRHHVAYQWDSFRWWETLVAGCAPITLDFDYWGLSLPVLPVEGEHYIGIEELDGRLAAEKLSNMPKEEYLRIGRAGRAWFEEHYSPKAQAQRLLDELLQRGCTIGAV